MRTYRERDFANVYRLQYKQFRPFQNVHCSWPFLRFSGLKKVTNVRKRSLNGGKRSWNVHTNVQEWWTLVTLNGQEHLWTFESERSNALELLVENVHGTDTLTFLKRKIYWNIFTTAVLSILKRERERDFVKRFTPLIMYSMNVSYRATFLTVPWPFLTIWRALETVMKRHSLLGFNRSWIVLYKIKRSEALLVYLRFT